MNTNHLRTDVDDMRGMKSYLSVSEMAVLAVLARLRTPTSAMEIAAKLPTVLQPQYRQGIGKMLRGLQARGYVARIEEERAGATAWVFYRATPQGRRLARRLITELMGVAGATPRGTILAPISGSQ